jgi:hypothetical protein
LQTLWGPCHYVSPSIVGHGVDYEFHFGTQAAFLERVSNDQLGFHVGTRFAFGPCAIRWGFVCEVVNDLAAFLQDHFTFALGAEIRRAAFRSKRVDSIALKFRD